MLPVATVAWLLGIAVLLRWPELGRSRAGFGLGVGALLGALLGAGASVGEAAAPLSTGERSGFESYVGGQLVWVGAVVVGVAGYGLSRVARGLPTSVRSGEALAIAVTSALLLAGTAPTGWRVPLAPVVAGGLAAIVQGRAARKWLIVGTTTVVFALAFAAADQLALIPRLAALGLGILGTTYAIGRWTDVHAEAANAPPTMVTYGTLAAGFVLAYWRPPL